MTSNQFKLAEPEYQLLGMVSSGAGNREIAQALNKSEYTVRNRLSRLYRKIDVANRAHAASWFRAHATQPVAVPAPEVEFVERRQMRVADRRAADQLHTGSTDSKDGVQSPK